MSGNQPTQSYMESFNLLQSAANELSQNNVTDVDRIIPLVQQGTQAYKNCMERITKVEAMLKELEVQNQPPGQS
ncbi:exodeoxyribonuclease VII small subunit [Photobacterium sp. ZSDE20]|uniref:Exodeoxyribonuclease VII small subunit n=1 Tax=Photobacterium pectinilyticum TaxID=2906793 RepID=A0ABT1N8K0_9GAMM|nr:exodeoxyribonuclease VII small subunit [Photobacterium sp. ZSDE20]MCQ1061083.1 exodeoxyribonuclease VII small subunit [Photobacterium sp. ZSDE20]MDD1826198.1 exodeoxyribonuclease VII small subunit [Photobacterium sp. ZSDE20]